MWNSPSDAFSEYVVQQSLWGMTNQQKVALAQWIRSKKWFIKMERENVWHALRIFLWIHPWFEGQIKITAALLKTMTSRLTDAVLNEWSILWTATAMGRKNALFTSWDVMNYA